MKKAVLVFLPFLIGLAIAAIVLVNPLQFSWIEPIQHQVLSLIQPMHHREAVEGQLWTCGMHPQVIQEEPGDCPICGMALTPLKNSTTSNSSSDTAEGKEDQILGRSDGSHLHPG